MAKTGLTKKEGKEEVLRSFVESSRRVVNGYSNEGLDESRELISKMVRFGRITEDQANVLEQRLAAKMHRVEKLFEEQVTEIVKKMSSRFEAIANEELTSLEKRTERLEGRRPVSQPKPLTP